MWHFVIPLIPLFWANANPLDSNFLISNFKVERVFDQPANTFWQPDSHSFATGPDSLSEQGFLLRRKFGRREYSLFPGTMRVGAYQTLFAFRLDSLPWLARLKTKFYSIARAQWFQDLDDLYFSGDLILATQPLLHWHDGEKWHELKSLPRKPVRLNVTSSPSSADIYLDGRWVGKTPYVKLGLTQPYVMIRVEEKGHYRREEPVNLSIQSEILVHWPLHPLLPADALPPGDSLPLAGFMLADAPNLEAYEAREAKLTARITEITIKRHQSLARFDSLYPPLKPREEFEKSSGFEERKVAYAKERAHQEESLTRELNGVLAQHTKALDSIQNHKRPFERELIRQKLEGAELNLQTYDADKEQYPFRLHSKQPALQFKVTGKFHLNPESARKLKTFPDSLLCQVQFWNLRLRLDSGSAAFVAMDSLFCAYSNQTVKLDTAHFAYPPDWEKNPDYSRLQYLQTQFESDRIKSAKQRLENEKLREEAAIVAKNKAKWKMVRRYCAVGLGVLAIGGGYFAYQENRAAESRFAQYEQAVSPQEAAHAKKWVSTHDSNVIVLGIASGLTLAASITLALF